MYLLILLLHGNIYIWVNLFIELLSQIIISKSHEKFSCLFNYLIISITLSDLLNVVIIIEIFSNFINLINLNIFIHKFSIIFHFIYHFTPTRYYKLKFS